MVYRENNKKAAQNIPDYNRDRSAITSRSLPRRTSILDEYFKSYSALEHEALQGLNEDVTKITYGRNIGEEQFLNQC